MTDPELCRNTDPTDNETTLRHPQSSASPAERDSFALRLRHRLPRALVYREWQLNRSRYILACALFVLVVVGPVMAGMLPPDLPTQVTRMVESIALSNLDHWEAVLPPLVAGFFGVLVMHADTGRDTVQYALSGPVRRRDLLRVKAAMGLLTIAVAYFVIWLSLGALSVSYPSASTSPAFIVMFGVAFAHALLGAALFMAGLAAACTSSSVLLAAAGTYLTAAIPLFITNLIHFFHSSPFTGLPLGVLQPRAVTITTSLISQFSPLAGFHTMTVQDAAFASPIGIVYALWFIAWTYGFWRLGARLFEAAPIEQMSDTFFFPVLWYVVLAGLCFISANVFARVFTDMRNGYIFLFWFVLLYAASWFAIKAVVRAAAQRRAGERGW